MLDPEAADGLPPALEGMARRMAEDTGYSINAFRLDFYGLCPACRNQTGGSNA